MDNVKFTSISDLILKSTLDGKEEIQVSAEEKINLLDTLHKYGKAELRTFGSTNTGLTLRDNTVNWFNSVSAAGTTNLLIDATRSPIISCIIIRAKLGHQIQIGGYHNIKLSNPDDKDPIIKHDGYGGLTLLGSGLYILEINAVPVGPGTYIIHLTCNYTQSDNVIRYKTSNNNRIYFSTQNEEAWNTFYPEVVHRYNEYLNIGEIETPSHIATIPSQAFSCYDVSVDNHNPTTHFLTEIWLPPTVFEVLAGAFVGCNYLRKFHGGVPGLVSEDGTQILNTYWNGNVELMAIAPGSCGHSLSSHVQGEAAKETLIFYIDERATSIGELVFAYMTETIPIRTLVFGRNVRTVASTSFFRNQCIETLILGDYFLYFNRGSLLNLYEYTNIPHRLSRVVCANHQPQILYRFIEPGGSAVEYILMSPIAKALGAFIQEAVPNSIVTSYDGGFMQVAYETLYPLDNEVVYSTYKDAPITGSHVGMEGIFNYYNGDPNEAVDYYDPVVSTDIKAGDQVLIGGLFTGNELSQRHWDQSEGKYIPYFRGVIDNPQGLDMYAGKPGDFRYNFLVIDSEDTSQYAQYGIVGNIKSLRFPRSVKGICANTITLGHMEGQLDVYFYSTSVVAVLPATNGSTTVFVPGPAYNGKPVVIHVVKGLKNDYLRIWSSALSLISGIVTIVDDLNVY